MTVKEFLEDKNIWVDQDDVYDKGTVFQKIGLVELLSEYSSLKAMEYGNFILECVRQNLPVLTFKDWNKL